MNVPQIQNLHSQSFNSKFVEFVWEFPKGVAAGHWRFICQYRKDGSVYWELGEYVEENSPFREKYPDRFNDDYFHDNAWCFEFSPYTEFDGFSNILIFDKYFNFGKDLTQLGHEAKEYLKEN